MCDDSPYLPQELTPTPISSDGGPRGWRRGKSASNSSNCDDAYGDEARSRSDALFLAPQATSPPQPQNTTRKSSVAPQSLLGGGGAATGATAAGAGVGAAAGVAAAGADRCSDELESQREANERRQ